MEIGDRSLKDGGGGKYLLLFVVSWIFILMYKNQFGIIEEGHQ
jgi:hypothetical protein